MMSFTAGGMLSESEVDVRWDGRKLVMFADDIEKRGEQVTHSIQR
jgi:hypothetical protein